MNRKQRKWLRKADNHTGSLLYRLGQLQRSGVAVNQPTAYAYHIRKHLKKLEEGDG